MENKSRVAHISQFSEDVPVPVQVEDVDLVAVLRNDRVTVFEGKCPHQGTMLSEGTLEDRALVCRGHGWRFDPASGAKLGDPNICLQSFHAEIEDDHVMIDRGQLLDWKHQDSREDAYAQHKPVRSLSQLPGPKGLPLLGNSLQVDLKQLHLILERWSEIYSIPPPSFRLALAPVFVPGGA
jgi:nitrite reductase/ring-hydroxylating ferredoxin subunit